MKVENAPLPSQIRNFLVIIKKSNLTQLVFFEDLVLYITKGCCKQSFCLKLLLQAHGFKTMLTFMFPS
jgi:hypothetical protein